MLDAGRGSRPRSGVKSSMARLEEDKHEMLSTTSAVPVAVATEETNERRVSGGSTRNAGLMVGGRSRRGIQYLEERTRLVTRGVGVRWENYTFRPVLFMRAVQKQQDRPQDLVEADEDENEIVLIEISKKFAVPTLCIIHDNRPR